MLEKLEGSKTYLVALFVAIYALLNHAFPGKLPVMGETEFVLLLTVVFTMLRMVTKKPGVLASTTPKAGG